MNCIKGDSQILPVLEPGLGKFRAESRVRIVRDRARVRAFQVGVTILGLKNRDSRPFWSPRPVSCTTALKTVICFSRIVFKSAVLNIIAEVRARTELYFKCLICRIVFSICYPFLRRSYQLPVCKADLFVSVPLLLAPCNLSGFLSRVWCASLLPRHNFHVSPHPILNFVDAVNVAFYSRLVGQPDHHIN
ncbi:hypothetical protein HOLleu_19973 [Holothuria leucospilota]|uniref:Uncharacterized protein n=1 Tax=Holothuria leucospilota TaxID=206669 RepID=A0A9Q1H829_HOLLE|nr:hypothetical protein HOLleu_19973 [Holothuria leucospilota]